MLENNSNSACNYAEQIVSFLYGEIEGAEKTKFELHLQNCASCADELSGFSAVRSSVLEWRAEEFEKLSTPVFALPGRKVEDALSTSRLNSIRGFFTFNSVSFSAALAIILFACGLFWFFSNSPVKNEIAENRQNPSENAVKAEESQNQKSSENDVKSDTLSKEITSDTNDFEKITSDKEIAPIKTIVHKNSNETQALKVKKYSSPVKPDKSIEKSVPKPVKTNNIPTLAVDEYEDNSLRLSDILEEVSMK